MSRSPLLPALCLPLLVAAALVGGPVDRARAAEISFVGSLAVQIATLDPIVVEGSGTAVVNGAGEAGPLEALELAAGAFSVSDLEVEVTAFEPITAVLADLVSQAGSFAADAGDFGGAMGVEGSVQLCLFAECVLADVPLGPIGIGGSETATSPAVAVTVTGAPWTIQEVALGDYSLAGYAIGADGDPGRILAPGGRLRLVTPIAVTWDIGLEAVPVFGVLTLQFVPEPGALVASGGAGLALAVLARRRRRP